MADPQEQSSAQVPPVSAGTLLREAREAAGLHIAALAVSLKVPVKKLEALEADRIDLLPDAVFARALAASVCRTLKTDPGPVLAALPQTTLSKLSSQSRMASAAFSSPGAETRTGTWNQISKPVLLSALALLVAALVIVMLPRTEGLLSFGGVARVGALVQTPPPAIQVPAAEVASPPPLIASTALAGTGLPDSAPTNANLPNTGVAPAFAASSGASAESGLGTAPVAGTDIVMLKATGSSWVEVLDAKRVVRLRKTMVPGEAIGVSADLPMYFTVGRADTIEVQVRGKPLDLASVTKDNVARFEVR
jgi:cytoskeleton protein RodZ